MLTRPEFVVAGSGLTGCVIARALHDQGRSVLVVERRGHIAGNVHDHAHPSGIRIHTYGPHYFRTNDDELWSFVNRFSAFHRYEASVHSLVDGRCEHWPVTESYIARHAGSDWAPEPGRHATNFEEASLAMMPRIIYEKFVRGYTEKQWGVPARALSADLANRFDVRKDGDTRLFRHRHQGIPERGYTAFVENILSGIPVMLNVDYLRHRDALRAKLRTVFTGPIDEYFGFDLGRLAYRGQRRRHTYHPDVDYLQPFAQVNNPDPASGTHIRTLEWKRMMDPAYAARIRGTVITQETPFSPDDPSDYEYPFPDSVNAALYSAYRARADGLRDVKICGRLGEYRYYDMDQAIARARKIARDLLLETGTPASKP